MPLHESTFGYLMPTDDQKATMEKGRAATKAYAAALDELIPDGPDKTFIMRELRGLAMWVNVAITRNADGSPRT